MEINIRNNYLKDGPIWRLRRPVYGILITSYGIFSIVIHLSMTKSESNQRCHHTWFNELQKKTCLVRRIKYAVTRLCNLCYIRVEVTGLPIK